MWRGLFWEAPLGLIGSRGKFRGLVSRVGVSSNLYWYCTAYLWLSLYGIVGRGHPAWPAWGKSATLGHGCKQNTKLKGSRAKIGLGSARIKSSLSCQLLKLRLLAFS